MRKLALFCMPCIFLALPLTSCGQSQTASASNFKTVINKYLAKTPPCVWINQPFPASELNSQLGDNLDQDAKLLKALNAAGLVHSSMVPMVKGIGGRPDGPGRIFELTDEGKKYLQPSQDGKPNLTNASFCYGTVVVHDIVDWTEPPGSLTEVTYTTELIGMPDWAKRPDVQDAGASMLSPGGPIRGELNFVAQQHTITLQLKHSGWQVMQQ